MLAEVLEDFEHTKHQAVQPFDTMNITVWYTGNSGCAAVFGALQPALRAEGFRLDQFENRPTSNSKDGFEAMELFFGLSASEAKFFFTSTAYPTLDATLPAHVATRIRKYTRTNPLPANTPVKPDAVEIANSIVRNHALTPREIAGYVTLASIMLAGVFSILSPFLT
jgi:hypothetical protein